MNAGPTPTLGSVIVIAKRPEPGRVKTRLTPPLTSADAARLAGAALADTLATVSAVPAREHVLAMDRAAAEWLPPGWREVRQASGGLDLRLAAAFAEVGPGPSVLVGMDTPQLRREDLTAFDPDRFDACLGLARDGGFWAVGFADADAARSVLPGVVMSTAQTGSVQLDRMERAGLRVQQLRVLTDVDTIESAVAVAAEAPDTRFSAMFATCTIGS